MESRFCSERDTFSQTIINELLYADKSMLISRWREIELIIIYS